MEKKTDAFAPGELVKLVTGYSPAMTVEYEDSQGVHCIWYNEREQEFKRLVTSFGALKKVP